MNAARGLRALCGLKAGRGGPPEPFALRGEDCESLLVAWLEESIYRLGARGQVLSRARFDEAGPKAAAGTASWRELGPGERPRLEVKAATYHGLHVTRRAGRFVATVILDV